MTPTEVRRLAWDGDLGQARQALRRCLEASADRDHVAWGRVAEELGEVDAALAEFEASGAEGLAALEALRRDLEDAAPVAEAVSEQGPSEVSLARFVHTFGGREGVHARQWHDPAAGGGYSPVHAPLTPELVRAHVQGTTTVGAYPIRLDGTVTWFCVDLDLTRKALTAAGADVDRRAALQRELAAGASEVAARLSQLGLRCLAEDSGNKGRHFWGLLDAPLPADLVHRFGRRLARALQPKSAKLHIEFFPKQGRVPPGGLGNLVKLPLGIHRRSGRRSVLLDAALRPADDPWAALRGAPRLGRADLLRALTTLRDDAPARPPAEPTATPDAAPVASPESLRSLPAVARILARCPVLATLVERALTERRLTHDEQVVLLHSVGHVAEATDALNALLAFCPEVPSSAFMKRPHRGHPISCARIRARVPDTTCRLDCHCDFGDLRGRYPCPLLHGRSS